MDCLKNTACTKANASQHSRWVSRSGSDLEIDVHRVGGWVRCVCKENNKLTAENIHGAKLQFECVKLQFCLKNTACTKASQHMLFVGCCPSMLACEGGHAVGYSASGWLACARRGHMHIGRDANAAAAVVMQSLPDVLEVWYFSLPPPRGLCSTLGTTAPGGGLGASV